MLEKKLHQIDAKILRQYRRRCKKDGIINPAEMCLASGESLGNFLPIIKFRVKLPGEYGGDRIGRKQMEAVMKPIILKQYHEYHLNGKLRIKYNPKYSIVAWLVSAVRSYNLAKSWFAGELPLYFSFRNTCQLRKPSISASGGPPDPPSELVLELRWGVPLMPKPKVFEGNLYF